MKICTSKDALWLTALMLNEKVFRGCSEDGFDKKQVASHVKSMLNTPGIVVLAPVPGKMVHTFVQKSRVMYEIHAAFHPKLELSGKDRVKLTRKACVFMIHRGARKFVTHIPENNRPAAHYAVACGLERACVLTKAMKRGGRLVDAILYQSRDEDIEKERRELCLS